MDSNLQISNHKLASEWHPTKNGSLTPGNVTLYNGKKVWWKCRRGHEWQSIVANRSRGRGCPYCAGKSVREDNCLETLNPVLVRE